MNKKNHIRWIVLAFLLSVCFFTAANTGAGAVQVQAASTDGWKQVGGYWYYYVNGQKKTGVLRLGSTTYYLDAAGRMCTGLVKLPQGRYYFDKSGAMVKNTWIKLKYWYYFGANGKAATNTFLEQKGKKYYVNQNGAMYTGLRTINGYKYYFDSSGVMQTGWVQIDSNYYYFSTDGRMRKGWLNLSDGTYFLHSNGRMAVGRVTNSKGQKYFFNNGKVKSNNTKLGVLQKGWIQVNANWYHTNETTGVMSFGLTTVNGKKYYLHPTSGIRQYGLKEINGKKYYFKPSSGEMAINTKITIGGVVYSFDKDGVGTMSQDYIVDNGVVKVMHNGRWIILQKEYLEHPGIADGTLSDDELLAALIYCEANDQGTAGLVAVAVTILNRTLKENSEFPNVLRHVIYQKNQYSPVFDGAMLRRLRNPKGEMYNECVSAVKKAKQIISNYQLKKTKRKITGFDMGSKTDFDYLYFMTPEAFERLNLDPVKCEMVQHRGHVFFTYWETKS